MTTPRVLVIDDDADMRMLMGALLEHLGASVSTAGNPDELAAAMDDPLDLVLLDLVMPGHAYDDCVAVLVERAIAAPICLLSGSGTQTLTEARARLDAAGLHTTMPLTKPARLDALGALLASLHPPAEPDRTS